MSTDSLVEWLRGVLGDEERVAQAAIYSNTTGRWHVQTEEGWLHEAVTDESGVRLSTGTTAVNAHAARHDPARVLRQVEANRKILDLHLSDELTIEGISAGCKGCGDPYPCPTVRLLASVYADRPGWKKEWEA